MTLRKETTQTLIAAVITGAISTFSTVAAMKVHIDYIKQSLTRIEAANERQDSQIRDLELNRALMAKTNAR